MAHELYSILSIFTVGIIFFFYTDLYRVIQYFIFEEHFYDDFKISRLKAVPIYNLLEIVYSFNCGILTE